MNTNEWLLGENRSLDLSKIVLVRLQYDMKRYLVDQAQVNRYLGLFPNKPLDSMAQVLFFVEIAEGFAYHCGNVRPAQMTEPSATV